MKAFPVVQARLFLLLWRDLCPTSCTALASSVQLGGDGVSSQLGLAEDRWVFPARSPSEPAATHSFSLV